MTYTPGPWYTDDTKSFYVFASGALAEQAGVNHGPFIANASTEANARLIAAAPDLLAALSAVMEQFVGDRNAENCPYAGGKIADQARTALLKAGVSA